MKLRSLLAGLAVGFALLARATAQDAVASPGLPPAAAPSPATDLKALVKKIGEKVEYGEKIYTLYSQNVYNLREGKDSVENFPISNLG